MNNAVSWALAVAALVAGFLAYGWRGLVLGATMIVFWGLLQFNRALRTMRSAALQPLGRVKSAVMLQSKLAQGMKLLDVIKLAGSLGERIADAPETFAWTDDGGDAVHVTLEGGRVSGWQLVRA